MNVNDKLDVFDRRDGGWHIATILQIEHEYNLTTLFIHYDGWEVKYDEFITINHTRVTSTKLKPLHTFTPYHAYLFDSSIKPCQWDLRTSRILKCDTCSRHGCNICYILESPKGSSKYQCKLCMDKLEPQQLFEAIHESLYNSYDIDINIIHLIADYSKGAIVSCSNHMDSCQNEILYNSMVDFELDLIKSHHGNGNKHSQYEPTYKYAPGTFTIHGKSRRIFCHKCDHDEKIQKCAYLGCNNWEIKTYTISGEEIAVCHQHGCSYSLYDSDSYCKNCKKSLMFEGGGYKCQECNDNICVDCEEYGGWTSSLYHSHIIQKCRICCDKEREQKTKDLSSMGRCKSIEACKSLDEAIGDYDMTIHSKYNKRLKSKVIQRNKSKTINNDRIYYKKRKNKISNMKQNRKFYKRHALSLQF